MRGLEQEINGNLEMMLWICIVRHGGGGGGVDEVAEGLKVLAKLVCKLNYHC
jgi:hypothetical protein